MEIEKSIIKVLKVRVKDKHSKILNRMAFESNQIWNTVNSEAAEWQYIPVPEAGYVRTNISAYDLQKQLKWVRPERRMIIGSDTANEVIAIHARCRRQAKRTKLKWRSSGGSRKSLGWVPFKGAQVKWRNGQVKFAGHYFSVWDSYGLSKYEFRAGSFSQDARGRWYFNVAIKVKPEQSKGVSQIGVDLGLKTTATCSSGETLERGNFYRSMEKKLGSAQRANKKHLVRTIHAKIKNRRSDTNHKFTTKLVKENSLIVVGNVSSSKLAKTKMAKSVLDAGWYQLKTQLDYKSKAMQVVFIEVNESYTTQTCSSCGCLPDSRPKGIAGLGIREWTCTECGATHDRDINAAKNILALGHERLAVGNLI